jgi:hypothetical protein
METEWSEYRIGKTTMQPSSFMKHEISAAHQSFKNASFQGSAEHPSHVAPSIETFQSVLKADLAAEGGMGVAYLLVFMTLLLLVVVL